MGSSTPPPPVLCMAFLDDLDTDRDNVFLNTVEFAESVTYRVASTGTESTITAQPEDVNDSEFEDGARFRISADTITSPVKGDQITWTSGGGGVYTVLFVTLEMGMYVLDCTREELVA